MTTLLLGLAVLAVVVGSVTCGSCPNQKEKQRILTYNVGLTTIVPGYDQRRSAVMEAVKNRAGDADFVCLQELWYEDDMNQMIEGMKEQFQHHFSAIHYAPDVLRESVPWYKKAFHRLKNVPCNVAKISALLGCYGIKCRNAADKRVCMVTSCGWFLYSLSNECRTCLSMSSSGPGDVYSKCTSLKHFNRFNRPGLLVLSKRKLISAKYVNYHENDPLLVERGYIEAQVEGGTTYICTHLTSVFPTYYDAKVTTFFNYEHMQSFEIWTLNATYKGKPHILLGDLNTGPQIPPDVEGESENNYNTLVYVLAYKNPYVKIDARCTYCRSENRVLEAGGKDPAGVDHVIDHVLLSPNLTASDFSAKRMFDKPADFLSDHFGVEVEACLP